MFGPTLAQTPTWRLQLFITATICSGLSNGLQIISLTVPPVIQNGTQSSVVLDCEYRYEPYEVDGLEVKWFWNDEPEAVYQWIPGKKPEALGMLKGRVNLSRKASDDKFSTYRSIELIDLSTDLSGTYTCRISSFHDEEVVSKKLIIYAPAKSMNLTFEKYELISVKFLCSATSVYPKPTIKLILLNDKKSTSIKPIKFEALENDDGSFNATVEAIVLDKKLPKETLLQCLVEIPGTEYRIRRQIVYFPGYRFHGYVGVSSQCEPSKLLQRGMSLAIIYFSFFFS